MKHFYLIFCFFFIAISYSQTSSSDIDGFKLYPNPVTSGKVYVSTTNNASKQIFIYDVFGAQILKTTILGTELNLRDLDSGVYVLRVFEQNKVATRKLIVK